MTTIHTTASMLERVAISRSKFALMAMAAAVSFGLAGCESGGNVLSGGAQPETNLAANAVPAAAQPKASLAKISIAPIIGAPDQVGRQLQQEFTTQVGLQKATVVPIGERSDFTIRGYIVAAKDKTNTKVSYIWDIADPTGKRVNRITGEEVVTGQAPKDPWSAVTPQITQTIAQKSAASFGAWLPTASISGPAVAGTSQPIGVGAGGAAPVQTASAPGVSTAQPKAQPAVATNASVTSSGTQAMVPSVVGAPGDGATSLTKALQAELTKNGVPLTEQQTAATYRVEGVVKVGASREGKQPIQIDWNVKDPQGKKLGTVSQKNEIPEGSLDGQWGQTASAAAAAAAQGILKLLPR